MNTNLKIKLLQYLNHKKQPSGLAFGVTLLFILLIIMVYLFFFGIPSLLDSSTKAKQSEARTYINTFNRAQQSYFAEKTQFAPDIKTLALGIKTLTPYYAYSTQIKNNKTPQAVVIYYTAYNPVKKLKNYVGFVSLIPSPINAKKLVSLGVLCEQKNLGEPPSLTIEWKPGIESPKCNKDQVQVGETSEEK
jgi:type IV pilus assembly protein PilA